MRDDRDYKLDLSSAAPAPAGNRIRVGRPFISVHFACCNVYQRVYRNADGLNYEGRCPRCGKSITFAVGPNGTAARSFVVE